MIGFKLAVERVPIMGTVVKNWAVAFIAFVVLRAIARCCSAPLLIAVGLMLSLPSSAIAEEGSIAITLNKLEAHDKDCRVYFAIDNKNDAINRS